MTKCKTPCPNECKENNEIQMIPRKDLEKHLREECMNREYECQHCGKKDTFTNITGIHDDVCDKKVLPCPNADCPDSMERAEIKQHLENDCEHTVISCKYERIGCDVKMKRKDMGAHEQDDKAHLHQVLNTVVKLQNDLQSATENMAAKLRRESENLRVWLRIEGFFILLFILVLWLSFNLYNTSLKDNNAINVTETIHSMKKESDDMAVKLKVATEQILSMKKESEDMAVKLKAATEQILSMKRENDDMAVKLKPATQQNLMHLMKKESEDMAVKLKAVTEQMKKESDIKLKAATEQLKKESDDMAVKLMEQILSMKKDMAVKATEEIASMKKKSDDMAVKSTENNILLGGLFLIIGFLFLSFYLYKGKKKSDDMAVKLNKVIKRQNEFKAPTKRTFKLVQYEKKKEANECFDLQSAIGGYNVQVRVYPNGHIIDKGTHVSAFVEILKSDNDDNLKWPLTVKLELLNHLNDKNHHLKMLLFNQEPNRAEYCRFIPHSQLINRLNWNTQYLKDDTLYFRVSVEVSNHKPWLECTL